MLLGILVLRTGFKKMILFTLITGAVFLIPFLFSSSTVDPILLPRFLCLSVLTFGLILMICWKHQGEKNPQGGIFHFMGILHRTIFPVFLCYLFISAISLTKAVNFSEGVFEWLKLFLFFAFFYAATLIIGSHKNSIPILSRSIAFAGTVLAFIGICQYYDLGFTSIPGNYVIYATMAHKNLFASALFLMLPFSLYGAIRFSHWWQISGLISSALIFFAILISGTRAVWLAIIVSAVPFLIARKRNRNPECKALLCDKAEPCTPELLISHAHTAPKEKHPQHPQGRISHPLKIFLLITIITCTIFYSVTSRFPLLSTDSLDERILLWKKTLMMIKDSPFMGAGLGQWKIVIPCYGRIEKLIYDQAGQMQSEVWFQRPHNDYLWVLSETGLGGFFSYVSLFFILVFYILRIVLKTPDRDKQIVAILMLSAVIGYMLISFFSFPRERIVHNIFLMLIFACVVSLYHHSFPISDFRTSNFKLLISNTVFLFFLIFCIVFGYARLNAEIHTAKALSAREVMRWERVISEIDRGRSFSYSMDPTSAPLFWYRGMANISLNRIREALDDFKKAHEIHPCHIHVLNNIGTCYALLKNDWMAVNFYQKALGISPGFEETLANLQILCSETEKYFQICSDWDDGNSGP